MVDEPRLAEILTRLQTEIAHLQRLAALPDERLGDDLMAAVKYRLVVAIEAAIDAANHVISSEGYRPPRDFADTFTVLGEAGLIDADLRDRLGDAARLRNLLVHEYARVDEGRIRTVIRSNLGDLSALRNAIGRLLDKPPA